MLFQNNKQKTLRTFVTKGLVFINLMRTYVLLHTSTQNPTGNHEPSAQLIVRYSGD